MKANASDIADFYQQLALLIKSNLPLPDSLRQLGRYFPKHDFQNAILEIGACTERGEKFSAVIGRYPRFFDPFHIQLISAGEASGTLPEVLFSVARFARFGQLLTARVRDIIAYPALTIHLCLVVFLFMSAYIIPPFADVYRDLLGTCQLPHMTALVVQIGDLISEHRQLLSAAYVVLLVFTLWLFVPCLAAHRTMLAVISLLPGSCRIVHSLDSARLCGMWSTFLRQNMTLPDAIRLSAELVESKALRQALLRAAGNMKSGSSAVEIMSRERAIDALVVLTFRHTPEEELAEELRRLGELFEHRVTLAARSATMTWTVAALVLMTLSVGFVVISLFLPLVTLVSTLGW